MTIKPSTTDTITTENLHHMFLTSQYYMHPVYFYYNHFKKIPDRMLFEDIQTENVFKALIKKFTIDEQQIFKTDLHDVHGEKIGSSMINLNDGILLFFHPSSFHEPEKIELLYHKASSKTYLEEVKRFILKHLKRNSDGQKIYLIVRENYGLELSAHKIAPIKQSLADNYNEDFEEFSKKMINHLNKKNQRGLFLLYGQSGTGKTSFIRHLIKVVKKKVIFLSPDLASELASPSFINFIGQYSNSVLIIEDAENIIEDRKSGSNASMSNLLNLSDGLLADCFNIQIICSFNMSISKIDKALLRKGRLTMSYEFKELEAHKATALSKKIGLNHQYDKPICLADIYYADQNQYEVKQDVKIGF